ncbi:hypothetical protein BKA70DRAFT_15736 [Coprinopsis sp. MPI-PUGE-AT-0042]|nr:hypothetical protein BKA70DRAFT_15736 [Coprinopsis sp. MPI-PUGE-AT-0042]
MPDKESGGRTGNNVYKLLEELGESHKEFAWATAHSWQSWRERYKKHAAKIDAMIEEAIPEMNPRRQHNWPTARDVKIRFPTKKLEDSDEGSSSDEDDQQRRSSSRAAVPPQKASPKRPGKIVAFAEEPVVQRKKGGTGSSRRATFEEPPAKRQRIDSEGNDRQQPTKAARRRPVSDEEEEDANDDDDGDHNSLFSGPEDAELTFAVDDGDELFEPAPGKSPLKEVVALDSPAPRRRSSAPHISQQSTLVGSAPAPRMSGGMEDMVDVEPEYVDNADDGYEADENEEFGLQDLEDTPAKSIHSQIPSSSGRSRPRSRPTRPSPAFQNLSAKQRAARKAASRTSPSSRVPPPPRMTRARSRSQSVEPESFQSLPYNTKRSKDKGKAIARDPSPQLEALEEEGLEDDVEQPRIETYEEEQDVLQLVTNAGDYSVGSSNPDESGLFDDGPMIIPPANARLPSRSRSASMESDDIQMSSQLGVGRTRPPPPVAPAPKPQKPRRTLNGDPLAALAAFTNRKTNPRLSLPAPSFTRVLSATPGPRGEAVRDLSHKKPRMVAHAGSDASSIESFPLKHTGAAAYKRRAQKEMVYNPPEGSRALESLRRSQAQQD